ncbi:MAG: hypothetical protein LJF30_00820 [Acidobacteria bacterium]|nr:hypothetical protein [Acidobacteriota bacterium]
MRRTSEKGEGRMSAFIFFALLIAAGLAAWNLFPVYYAHYDFTDKVEEICRMPRYQLRRGVPEEQAIKDLLMKEVTERRLSQWVKPNSFRITTTDHSRQIFLNYEREVEILPGWKRTLKFDYEADQPLI